MPVINSIAAYSPEMTEWRRDLHENPEIAFEEVRTSDIVAEKLASWGIEVHRDIAKTGVVGVLKVGDGKGTIGLRADMDALPMQEENEFAHRSKTDGKMHACGHDGHTTMLLGAAKYLAETRNFDGTVHFIFQPGEEGAAGGLKMVEEGLFERFPCDQVFGMHNWPTMPAGTIGLRSGPLMAAADKFTVHIEGKGGHAALPHTTVDPVIISAQLVNAFQTLVSRSTSPLESAVISVTTIKAGTTFNVIPRTLTMTGTVRTFKPEIQQMIEQGMGRMVEQICDSFGAKGTFIYDGGYPATINHAAETEFAAEVAREVVGPENVTTDAEPSMGGEDFAYMLLERPGSYFFVGQAGGHSDAMVHNPTYDFNDEILPIGASMFSRLVETALPRPQGE